MPDVLTDMPVTDQSVDQRQDPQPESKNTRAPAGYVLLGRLKGETKWSEFGDAQADSPDAAIEKLAEENNTVAEAIAKEQAEIVAVSKRFWVVRTPSYSKPELRF